MVTLDLKSMSREEKLATLEALWDDLTQDPSTLPSPAWHEQSLAEAEATYQAGTATFRSLDDVKLRIRQATR